jgi:hypothetical protein
MGTLSLEKKVRVLSSKHTKHINEKYILIKDYYDAGETHLGYCPKGETWVDILTNCFKFSCSGISGCSFKIAQGTMMMTSNDKNMNERIN